MVYSVTITVLGLTRGSCFGQKSGGGLVLVSGEEDRVVGVPAEGTVAAGVRSVVNMVRARVGCGSVVRVAANN